MAQISYSIGNYGTYEVYQVDNEDRSVLVQADWDFPGLANTFGWIPCRCGATDGTVDCQHKTATQMISEAADYLDSNEGKVVDDPGYFSE